ncbi:MAG: ABC transporter permease [Alphaproteobacteria bacterium]|nr:ABC transporter permease [Alphaproteobacteria bacterium]
MTLLFDIQNNILSLCLKGDYVGYENEREKSSLMQIITSKKISTINIDAKHLKKWDSTLVVILFTLSNLAQSKKIKITLHHFPKELERLLKLALTVDQKKPSPTKNNLSFIDMIGLWGINVYHSARMGVNFIKKTFGAIGRLITGRAIMRKVDFLFALQDCGWKAIPIVSLISFMVGLILAFVGAVQLKLFGAQIYVASLVTIGMTRIMGAIMIGIIIAGRTGASYAATIGTMQVNEEIDALKTMGIPTTDFLVLPRFLALVLTMPFLTMWADFMGMIGGGTVSILMLDIVPQEYVRYSINAFNLDNFLVGIFHGLVFGCVIALCGCYYGINCGRDADSVGIATTKSVVSAIVWMIVMTGIITLACEVIGV